MSCLILNPFNQLNVSQFRVNIIDAMSGLGIIGKQIIKNNKNYYLAGNKYLQHISFLGCAPNLNFQPHKEIKLSDFKKTIANLNYIQFYFGSNNYCFKKIDFGVKAICPACKTKIPEWNQLIVNWEKNSEIDSFCPLCNQPISIIDINWKKTAGFFQTAIFFYGIQAELAVPTDELLAQLEKTTKVKWQYFYGC